MTRNCGINNVTSQCAMPQTQTEQLYPTAADEASVGGAAARKTVPMPSQALEAALKCRNTTTTTRTQGNQSNSFDCAVTTCKPLLLLPACLACVVVVVVSCPCCPVAKSDQPQTTTQAHQQQVLLFLVILPCDVALEEPLMLEQFVASKMVKITTAACQACGWSHSQHPAERKQQPTQKPANTAMCGVLITITVASNPMTATAAGPCPLPVRVPYKHTCTSACRPP